MRYLEKLRFGVLACGVLGLVACFLPMGAALSFFDTRVLDQGAQVYMVMAGYALPAAMGAMAAAKGMYRWQSVVAIVGFAFVIFKFRGLFLTLITDGEIGAKLMGIAAALGLVCAIVTVVTPEPEPTS